MVVVVLVEESPFRPPCIIVFFFLCFGLLLELEQKEKKRDAPWASLLRRTSTRRGIAKLEICLLGGVCVVAGVVGSGSSDNLWHPVGGSSGGGGSGGGSGGSSRCCTIITTVQWGRKDGRPRSYGARLG